MGQASIGTVVNPGTTLVPQAVAAVKRDFPDILIKVEMDYSRPLVAKLLDGQLDIVIGRMTVWEAAIGTASLNVIFVGVAITLPVIILYTAFMYKVFWGKAKALSYQ